MYPESRDEHIFKKSNIDSNRRKTYSLASKTSSEFRTRQKISESRDEHIFFFALDYVLESLQKSKLYVNNKKSSITRENAFLRQIEQFRSLSY